MYVCILMLYTSFCIFWSEVACISQVFKNYPKYFSKISEIKHHWTTNHTEASELPSSLKLNCISSLFSRQVTVHVFVPKISGMGLSVQYACAPNTIIVNVKGGSTEQSCLCTVTPLSELNHQCLLFCVPSQESLSTLETRGLEQDLWYKSFSIQNICFVNCIIPAETGVGCIVGEVRR